MIIRLVRMHFSAETSKQFLTIFEEMNQHIRSFEGCQGLELYREIDDAHSFTTYSFWDSIEHLETYRNSELFKATWAKVKPLMRSKPSAVSYERVYPKE
ncbi:MAG: putative quinol monooxygenase [Chlorobiales bacterium]